MSSTPERGKTTGTAADSSREGSVEPSPMALHPQDEHDGHAKVESSEEESQEESGEGTGESDDEEDEDENEEEEEEEEEEDEDEDENDEEYEDEEEEDAEEECDECGSEEEEDEEPKLNYQRLGAGIGDMLKKDSASATTVSDRFLAMGTHWGVVHIMDFDGNENQKFQAHSATVNDLSVDLDGEFIASASDDGKVVINGLFMDEDNERHIFNYKRPVKAVALEPHYARSNARQFVSGGMAGQLILNEKGWFGNRDVVLHSGEGPIYAIKWCGNFIAWSNDLGVKIYDTTTEQRITFIDRPGSSPRADLFKCRLCWRNETELLIGWAALVKIAVIKNRPKDQMKAGLPAQYVEITTMFQTDFIVCGIAPFKDMLLLMAYVVDDIDEIAHMTDAERSERKLAKRPELRIINAYNEEISSDALTLHGYTHYQANDYMFENLPSQDMFYIGSPKDLVVAKERDLDDHIEWLMERERYEEALGHAREAQIYGGSKKFNASEIGQKYLGWLLEQEEYDKAAEQCPSILGSDAELWEHWIYAFAEAKQLKAIAGYIPFKEPTLSDTIYELVLAYFLMHDHQSLFKTVKSFPPGLYNIQNVIVAVEDRLKQDKDNVLLMESLAELYTRDGRADRALEYFLRLRRPNVFDLIREHDLFSAVRDKAVLLMDFDQYLYDKTMKEKADAQALESEKTKDATTMEQTPQPTAEEELTKGPAVQLMVQHTDEIPIKRVVSQLKGQPRLLHIYLDALFIRDPHLGFESHNLQVELYAAYAPGKLIDFLRASNYYSLEKAYHTCEQRDLVPEMVFLLGRMGNNKKALMLIIERLGDVERAINFAKEQNDDDLWEDLLKYSMDKPHFIRGLLQNVGTEIDPIRLIRRIPNGLEIPDLRPALMKILQDFNLQMSLREGCRRILVSDSVAMADQLQRSQKRGISCSEETLCSACQEPIFTRGGNRLPGASISTFVMFFCRHVYHDKCLFADDEETMPRMKSSLTKVTLRAKANHAALIRSKRGRTPCPLCLDQAKVEVGSSH
ncbi:Vacuolar protein sorting-associated protein 41 [Mortierella polycephala]|uniref:Vacuolar protein sorting-associated protein 41 n=1 Tax=Mortierella polycephala TaxID=41804 RepID=A0A9P6PYE8_9FUNG|nr:Vacuolar protein sorting-associated protein 41 [Mortierella polycephala]